MKRNHIDSKVVRVKLAGGLGNQLFQYALGRNLAIKNQTRLELDISNLGKSEVNGRYYALNVFTLNPNVTIIGTNRLVSLIERFGLNALFRKILKPKLVFSHVKECDFSFDESVIQSKGNLLIEGYWQSEKYFSDNANTVKSDLTLKPEHQGLINKNLFNHIKENNSVAIHVRRGDYVNKPSAHETHGLCSVDYYKKAIALIESKVNKPIFFVFSDDIEWCKENFRETESLEFVVGEKDYIDLFLMGNCKHHIIANSSFSWWAAWINNNPQKIVISPSKWFNDLTINTTDLIPIGWHKL